MKLTWLEVKHLRRFANGLRIDAFDPGINVFAGPNGSGKSSIIRAIRAAFIERYQSQQPDLTSLVDPGTSPSVALRFEHNGEQYELHKQFNKASFARLARGADRFDNAAADDELAALLGFHFGRRGSNRPENLGVPGLLWIEQGTGQALAEPLAFARGYLRDALSAQVGELTTSEGDAVLTELVSQRNELLAQRTGKPRGDYDQAVRAMQALHESIASLQREQQHYRGMVDDLAGLQNEEQRLLDRAPWEALASELAQARRALADGQEQQARLDKMQAAQQQLEGEIALLQMRQRARHDQLALVETRRAALAQASDDERGARLACERVQQQTERERVLFKVQQAQLDTAIAQAQQGVLKRELVILRERLEQAVQRFEQAHSLDQRVGEQRGILARGQPLLADAAQVRELEQQITVRQAHIQSSATTVRWRLQAGQSARLDDLPIDGDGEHRLDRPATIRIEDIGEIIVTPGGSMDKDEGESLAQLVAQRDGLLTRHGVASAAALEQRVTQHGQDERELQLLQKQLAALAPNGLDGLREQVSRCHDAVAEAQQRFDLSSAMTDTQPEQPEGSAQQVDPEVLRAQLHELRDKAAAGDKQQQAAETQRALATAAREAADKEFRDASALAMNAGGADDDAHIAAQLQGLQQRHETNQQEIDVLVQVVGALQLDVLAQDIERLERSEQAARKQLDDTRGRQRELRARLAEAGARGTDEALAIQQAECSRLERRVAAYEKRAQALTLLVERLEHARRDATEQLLAPLRAHIEHYLGLLMPGATLSLDEELQPAQLQGPDGSLATSQGFDLQSFGTREQLALIARLAYADLLREAGQPAMIILDDGLVHTDDTRLQRMKRVLFDAAQRHQVLIFTCHQERWQDLGVAIRQVRDLELASA